MNEKARELVGKGVKIPNPESVEIGDEVKVERIFPGVTIHSGCKIFGSDTLICEGARIGYEGPATVDNCQIGPDAAIESGYFTRAVFLEKAKLGYGAHVRAGTILEERASIAHTVGLKQTILFPFVTLGSLINFCDCLMSGGTGPKNHSEVGSSYIHFNFTPNQDKATASLIGDVPMGVMLNKPPIFLGGQGGLVGPCRVAFGTVVAAGSICRKDVTLERRLIIQGSGKGGELPYIPGGYGGIQRIVVNNVAYIANLYALMQWYGQVRSRFVSDRFPNPLWEGLREKLEMAIAERIKRLRHFALKINDADETLPPKKRELVDNWEDVEGVFGAQREFEGDVKLRDAFLESLEREIASHGKDYIGVIQGLDNEMSECGTQWLQGIVDHVTETVLSALPSF